MVNSQKVLVVCGPTGVGKTSLALRLAKKLDGELISADSRQVYKGMDIGTGKGIPVNSKFEIRSTKQGKKIGYYLIDGIRVWLYDVVEPDYQFNVADYIECANVVIKNIWKRKKLPILVGGTGFYIKALIDGIETIGVEPDWELREKLGSYGVKELQRILERTCPERSRRMNESDKNNPRRLIRAIEIARQRYTSEVSPRQRRGPSTSEVKPLFIGLKAPNKILYQKIDQRVNERVKKGAEQEVRNLLKIGYNFDNSVLGTTMGYKEWKHGFGPNAVERWKYDEHAYARRQMTWFKKDKRINWFEITEPNFQLKVEEVVKEWYDKN